MSSERDELALMASDEIGYECTHTGTLDDSVPGGCPDCYELGGKVADAILAAGYRKPRTITTVEELDALAQGSIVAGDWATYQKVMGAWVTFGSPETNAVALPATVLHEAVTP